MQVSIPYSALCKQAWALTREASLDVVFNHAIRTLVFGALVGQQQKITFARELFFLGAIFHDLGLTERSDGLEKSPEVTAYTWLMELARDHVHGFHCPLFEEAIRAAPCAD